MALTEDQIVRYSRQILLREVGGKGQQRLLEARAAVEGSAGAAESAAEYLRAGGTQLDPGAAVRLFVSRGRIALLLDGGCDRCFRALQEGARPSESVAIGAQGALIAQRAILGIERAPLQSWAVNEAQELQPEAPPACPHR